MSFRALSVQQPWVWLILRPDIVGAEARAAARAAGHMKDLENRTWEAPMRGWVLLHASATRIAKWDYASAAVFAAKRGVEVPHRHSLDYGAIVGAVRIDGVVERPMSPWFTGPKAFVLGAAVPFAEPMPFVGALKFFPVPAEGVQSSPEEFARVCAVIRAAGLAEQFRVKESGA